MQYDMVLNVVGYYDVIFYFYFSALKNFYKFNTSQMLILSSDVSYSCSFLITKCNLKFICKLISKINLVTNISYYCPMCQL